MKTTITSNVTDIRITKTITLRIKSPYGWFFTEKSPIKALYNSIHRELAVVIPGADCHLSFKVKTKAFLPTEKILLKEYAEICSKYKITNIFNRQ